MTELAVLVPVLNRPQNVAPLVESFLVGCPEDSQLWFIVNANDYDEYGEVREHRGKRVDYLFADGTTWASKINRGTDCVSSADWYLCAADDVTFTPGWWEATKELRDDERIGVIGTNDSTTGTGNPRVLAGEHTCHPLVRRSYIETCGTIDTPGLAVHPGYQHWCVDDELVWTAKLRNAWAFCRDAVIEHHHPFWKPNEVAWDDTYAKGDANKEADMALWLYRAEHVLGLRVQK